MIFAVKRGHLLDKMGLFGSEAYWVIFGIPISLLKNKK